MTVLSNDSCGNMSNKRNELSFGQAVQVNPAIPLNKGEAYPFVEMAAVSPDSKSAYPSEVRRFTGGGSRFQHGDTLMARITPCLENGKIARYSAPDGTKTAHGSTEFIVIRGRDGVTDNDFAYYLTQWEEVRNYAIGQMTGTSGRQRVPVDSLNHLTIPIPPLAEQRAIAHVPGHPGRQDRTEPADEPDPGGNGPGPSSKTGSWTSAPPGPRWRGRNPTYRRNCGTCFPTNWRIRNWGRYRKGGK